MACNRESISKHKSNEKGLLRDCNFICLCLFMTYSPTITAITTVENDDISNSIGMMETVEQMMPLNVIDTCVELSSWMSAVY